MVLVENGSVGASRYKERKLNVFFMYTVSNMTHCFPTQRPRKKVNLLVTE